jgi:hypothetical protein
MRHFPCAPEVGPCLTKIVKPVPIQPRFGFAFETVGITEQKKSDLFYPISTKEDKKVTFLTDFCITVLRIRPLK